MNTNTLFVPMEVQAMVVNDQARKAENFQRWQMNYRNLESYASPMPDAFSGNTAIAWNNDPSANGVYLHWTLPHALRTGKQDNITGSTEYPLVPNRWLIVRYQGPLKVRTATAWVVESDFIDPNDGTSPYIDPNSSEQLTVTMIGRKLPLSGWTEDNNQDLFLTAVGTGDINFAAYQPYVENVFSIHDPLTDVVDPDLSYMIAGWYSNPADDILASVDSQQVFLDLLETLSWESDPSISDFCNTSVYYGVCYGIQWSKTGPAPASDRPENATIAVGNTSIDALTALITEQAADNENIDPQLLEAFQYNLLPLLDQPNGPGLLYQAIHKAWFGALQGGYEWVIVKAPSDSDGDDSEEPFPTTAIDWTDPNLTPDWLSSLNQDQANFDEAWRTAQALQWELYKMWWTKGKFDNVGPSDQNNLKGADSNFTDTNFEQELDVTQADSIAQKVQNQNQEAALLLGKIPFGKTQEDLKTSIQQYATTNSLPEGYQLKRYEKGSYYKASDPVVLISGSKASASLVEDGNLSCRFSSQLITGLEFRSQHIDATTMNGAIPTVDLTNVSEVPDALLTEFFFLDPNNATMIANAALNTTNAKTIKALSDQITAHTGLSGTLPATNLANWEQPWSPMFLLWTVMYYPIAHDVEGGENWSFDGQAYMLSDQNMPQSRPQEFILSGTTLLTPQSSFNFKRRLDEFRQKHPGLDQNELQALEDFISSTDDWDFLSQTLDGLTQQLSSREVESNVTPGSSDPTSDLIGSNNSIVPMLGAVPQPFEGWPQSNFQTYRSGQFCFQKLALVDRFGQTLQLSSTDTFLQLKPVIAPDMLPEHTVLSQEPDRFIQLNPRLLQPARLDFDFVAATDDSKIINLHSDTNPVCAWVLPNHIDKSLACYDPYGTYCGELRIITNDQANKVVSWDFGPNASFTSLADLSVALPHLGEVLNALISKGPEAFNNFYQVIDSTLWMVDPLGNRDDQNLTILVGRPLALTRCRLKYNLNGPPVTDSTWQYTFEPADPAFIEYTFPIRLGELAFRNDGLIGYFTGSNYDQFNCVHAPTDGTITRIRNPYVKQIGIDNFIDLTFQDESETYLTMLIDPRASVHATTAILPITTLELPARFVEPALSVMEVNFRVGPILCETFQVKNEQTEEDELTMLLPKPSEQKGIWSWLEQDNSNWKGYPLQSPDEKARFSNVQSVLRSGLMRLTSTDLENTTEG